jgi:tetratricopeptide (TPR) repeat protein
MKYFVVWSFAVLLLLPRAVLGADGGAMPEGGEPRGFWAEEPFIAAPEDLVRAADQSPPSDELEVQVFFEEWRYRFDDAGRQWRAHTLVYRPLTQAGAERWSTTEARWEPWHQQRPEFQVRVIAPDCSVSELDPATLSEAPAADGRSRIFDDRRIIHGPIPAMQAGVVVEERIITSETVSAYPEGTLRSYYPGGSMPVRHARLVVEAPADVPLHFQGFNLEAEPRLEREGDLLRRVFDFTDVVSLEDPDPGLPPEVARYPHITFTTGASWQRIAARYARIVDEQIAGADLAQQAAALAGMDPSTDGRIAAALGMVQRDVRYTGLEFGESRIVPYSPEEVLSRQYGDCKDQATLLVSLLRAMEIPAHVALLRAGFGGDIEPDLPGLSAFNHAIVVIPGHEPLWIDPTERYGKLGVLPLSDQGRLALIAAPDTEGLVRIPPPTAAANGEVEVREVVLANLGPARFTSSTTARGSYELDYRWDYATSGREAIREGLEQWVESEFLAEDLSGFSHSPPDDLSQPFVLTVEVADAGRGVTTMDEAAVAIRFDSMIRSFPTVLLKQDEQAEVPPQTGDFAEPASLVGSDGGAVVGPVACARQHDFYFTSPFTLEWQYRVTPPTGFRIEHLPDSRETALGGGSFSETYEAGEDGVVLATIRCDSGPTRIDPGQFAATRDALVELQARDPVLIRFQHQGQAHLGAGRYVEALREFRALLDRDPDNVLHRVRLARGLLAAGFGDQARREAEMAVQADPRSLPAHKALAWILQHDHIGRRFGEGFDLAAADGAEEAVRRISRIYGTASARRQAYSDTGLHLLRIRRYPEASRLLAMSAQGAPGAADLLALSQRLQQTVRFEELDPDLATPDGATVEVLKRLAFGGTGTNGVKALLDATSIEVRDPEDLAGFDDGLWAGTRFALEPQDALPMKVVFDLALSAMDIRKDEKGRISRVDAIGVGDAGMDLGNYYFRRDHLGRCRLIATQGEPEVLGGVALLLAERGDAEEARTLLDWAWDEVRGFESADPFGGSAFTELWKKGEEADLQTVRQAAAVLAVHGNQTERCVRLLESWTGDLPPSRRRDVLQFVLARGYGQLDRVDSMVELTGHLLAAHPDSEALFVAHSQGLARLRRLDAARAAAEERLARRPGDAMAYRILSDIAASEGDYEQADRWYAEVISAADVYAYDFNTRAWLALFRDAVNDETISWAHTAASRSAGDPTISLHTLAALYAEADRPAEAYQVILQAIGARPGYPIESDDWYVFGRMAEGYGLDDAARNSYRKVEPDEYEEFNSVSTYKLAQRRLADLRSRR